MIKKHSTVRGRKMWDVPTRWLYKQGMLGNSILDYGCGMGTTVDTLRGLNIETDGFDVYPVRTEFSVIKFKEYDTIICNYVLNVIEDPKEVKKVINTLMTYHRVFKTRVFISVRSDVVSVKESWIPCGDGWKTSKSFQRFYDNEKLIQLGIDNDVNVEILKSTKTYTLIELTEK